MPDSASIRHAVEALAKHVQRHPDVDQALQMITKSALDTIPRFDYVSISARNGARDLQTLAPTDPIASQVDQLQYSVSEGPCYEVTDGQRVLGATDLANDARWPVFGPKAAELGIRAQLAVLMVSDNHQRLALNFHAVEAGGFGDSVELASLFASHAALVMGFTRTVASLDAAVKSRQVIGQAIGILMERYDIGEDRAFSVLVRVSQDSNIKLRVVAQDLVDRVKHRTEGMARGQTGHRSSRAADLPEGHAAKVPGLRLPASGPSM